MLPNKQLNAIFHLHIWAFSYSKEHRFWLIVHGITRHSPTKKANINSTTKEKKTSFVLLSRLCKSVSPSNSYGLVFISPNKKSEKKTTYKNVMWRIWTFFSLSYLHRVTYTIYGETFNLFVHLNASTLSLTQRPESKVKKWTGH